MPMLQSVAPLHHRAFDPGLPVRQGAESSQHRGRPIGVIQAFTRSSSVPPAGWLTGGHEPSGRGFVTREVVVLERVPHLPHPA